MSGKLLQLANHHTASRIIQFCAKWGTAKDRTVLLGEVKLNLVELAKSKYGHFLVRKLINSTSNKDPEGARRGGACPLPAMVVHSSRGGATLSLTVCSQHVLLVLGVRIAWLCKRVAACSLATVAGAGPMQQALLGLMRVARGGPSAGVLYTFACAGLNPLQILRGATAMQSPRRSLHTGAHYQ